MAFFAAVTNSFTISRLSLGTRYFGEKLFSISTESCERSKSRTCPTEALTVYPFPRNLPTVLAFAGDSTITNFPLRLLRGFRGFFSGGVIPSWSSVRPIRFIFVPQTVQVPFVTGAPIALKAATGLLISRFDLHFTQYASTNKTPLNILFEACPFQMIHHLFDSLGLRFWTNQKNIPGINHNQFVYTDCYNQSVCIITANHRMMRIEPNM